MDKLKKITLTSKIANSEAQVTIKTDQLAAVLLIEHLFATIHLVREIDKKHNGKENEKDIEITIKNSIEALTKDRSME